MAVWMLFLLYNTTKQTQCKYKYEIEKHSLGQSTRFDGPTTLWTDE